MTRRAFRELKQGDFVLYEGRKDWICVVAWKDHESAHIDPWDVPPDALIYSFPDPEQIEGPVEPDGAFL